MSRISDSEEFTFQLTGIAKAKIKYIICHIMIIVIKKN